ncbi:hypothetical protein P3T36_003314 [Kitasatospora sp. MAP12-15]|uniref:hypothetical protein n=1 Tax=unclassified Kitasatospora TaxID=2633591 RepID=UPI002476EE23|nr:hypothetical protein [Kitasatospora sp. MAP12-44]MDH6111290.1 hypothetical protein [Kitasatospora sp. MAP12-44]
MPDSVHGRQEVCRTAVGLFGGAALCILMAVGTGSHWLVLPAVGLLVGAVVLAYRILNGQRYGYWVAWAAATVVSVLVAWVQPDGRVLQLPLACLTAVVAVVSFMRWCAHRP